MSSQPDSSPAKHRKTCRRYNEFGHAHAFTFSCFQRRLFLSRARSREWLIDAIDRASVKHRFCVWAYVVMPEHAHLLIYPTEAEYDVSRILATIKRSVSETALAFVRANAPEFLAQMRDEQPNGKVAHRFWQRGGGYDRNLYSPKYIWQMIDYIHENPVRRGLCENPWDWSWSSAGDYLLGRPGRLKIEIDHLPDDPR